MCFGTPVVHQIHSFLRLVNCCAPATLIQHIEVSVRDNAEYFDNDIGVWIKTCHLLYVSMYALTSGGRSPYLAVNPDKWMTPVQVCHSKMSGQPQRCSLAKNQWQIKREPEGVMGLDLN